jgi:hypothetical protein
MILGMLRHRVGSLILALAAAWARPCPGQAPPAPAAAPAPDSTPARLCADSSLAGGGVIGDVLVVVFSSRARPAERTAAVKSVSGTIVARVGPGEDGTYYVRVPTGGDEQQLGALTDHLIRLRQVESAGPATCAPRPPPAPAAAPAAAGPDTTRRPDSARKVDTTRKAAPPDSAPRR